MRVSLRARHGYYWFFCCVSAGIFMKQMDRIIHTLVAVFFRLFRVRLLLILVVIVSRSIIDIIVFVNIFRLLRKRRLFVFNSLMAPVLRVPSTWGILRVPSTWGILRVSTTRSIL